MKTEFLKGLGLTDEQINSIFAENGKDINAEKAKTQKALDELKTEQETRQDLEKQLGELKTAQGDSQKLKDQIDALQKQIDERAEADKKALEDKNLADRFGSVAGEAKFVNDLTKKGILEEFRAALADEKNKGKGDKELYESLTKDRESIFANANPPAPIPGPEHNVNIDTAEMSKIRTAMGLKPVTE